MRRIVRGGVLRGAGSDDVIEGLLCVSTAEWNKMLAQAQGHSDAIAAERERCAKLCEDIGVQRDKYEVSSAYLLLKRVAAEIRKGTSHERATPEKPDAAPD